MKELLARFDTVHFGFWDAALVPALEIESGDEIPMGFHDAYRFCSIAADLRVTQFVNGNRGIHAMLARSLLRQLPCASDLFAGLADESGGSRA